MANAIMLSPCGAAVAFTANGGTVTVTDGGYQLFTPDEEGDTAAEEFVTTVNGRSIT